MTGNSNRRFFILFLLKKVTSFLSLYLARFHRLLRSRLLRTIIRKVKEQADWSVSCSKRWRLDRGLERYIVTKNPKPVAFSSRPRLAQNVVITKLTKPMCSAGLKLKAIIIIIFFCFYNVYTWESLKVYLSVLEWKKSTIYVLYFNYSENSIN